MYRILLKPIDPERKLEWYMEDGHIYETDIEDDIKNKYLQVIKTMPTDNVEITKVVTTELVVNLNTLTNPELVD